EPREGHMRLLPGDGARPTPCAAGARRTSEARGQAERSPMSRRPALDREEFRRLGHRAVDLIAEYLDTIASRPVFAPMPASARAALVDRPLPNVGADPDTLL